MVKTIDGPQPELDENHPRAYDDVSMTSSALLQNVP